MARDEIMRFALDKLGYESKQEFIEEVLIRAFIDAYARIGNPVLKEEKIRDRFVYDFENTNPLTGALLQAQLLFLNWERWVSHNKTEKRRVDISFSFCGFDFIIECKRLSYADSKYLTEGTRRFVECEYAKKDSRAGMIGFVISGKIEHIAENLKDKVKTFYFTPGAEHLLDLKCAGWKYSFQSSHQRVEGAPVHLYHLFFDFSPKA